MPKTYLAQESLLVGVILQAEEGGMQPQGHTVTCEWQRGPGSAILSSLL